MKDCSSCKNSPLNNSNLAGEVFEKTPCYLCVLEDRKKNEEDRNFIESCGDVEFDEALHSHISSVVDGSVGCFRMRSSRMRRALKMKVAVFDLIVARKIDSVDCQIIELLMAYPTPSGREIARRMKMLDETVRLKMGRLKRLLLERCEDKTA